MSNKKSFGDVDSFVVDRRTWLRGNGPDSSSLLDENGCGCCLGHYAKACSLPDELIQYEESPAGVCANPSSEYGAIPWITKLLQSELDDDGNLSETGVCMRLMAVNDATDISDSKREERLTQLFASIGIAVKFEN